ncbi:MAG: hypothetical protein ACPGEF_07510, partial [Endozoicomonas sp.]
MLLISCHTAASSGPGITATYYLENPQGETIRCHTSGHESISMRQEMQLHGCTLQTLAAQADIDVTVTFASEGTTRS